MSIRDQVHAVLSEVFPARAPMTAIEYVSVSELPKGRLGVVVRLVVWDVHEGVRAIRDIKEQEISILPPTDLARFATFTRALVRVVARVLDQPDIQRYMPYDFIKFDALKLAKASTEDDFVKALEMKSRLGQYLPAQATLASASSSSE